MQRVSGAPVEIVLILEGLILLFLLMSDVAIDARRSERHAPRRSKGAVA